MWLRSDSTIRRSRRCSVRTATIAPNSILTLSRRLKPGSKSVKLYPTTTNHNNNNNNACSRKPTGVATTTKLIKCNTNANAARSPPVVKRLNAVRNNRSVLRRPKSRNTEKENIWKDSNEMTLYEQCSNNVCHMKSMPARDSGLGPPNDGLNNFGPISLTNGSCQRDTTLNRSQFEAPIPNSSNSNNFNNEAVSTTDACNVGGDIFQVSCDQIESESHQEITERHEIETSMVNAKCVSECDSTTDYLNSGLHAALNDNARMSLSLAGGSSTLEIIDPHVDSTTDLLSSDPVNEIAQSLSATYPFCYPSKYNDAKQMSASTCISDLISIFQEEELAKSSSTAMSSLSPAPSSSNNDLCQYDLMYSPILTQAFLNCTETTVQLCDNTDQISQHHQDSSTASSSSSFCQTAIDNLKALTNLPTQSLFSTLNLSKCGPSEVNSLITSVSSNLQDHGSEISANCFRSPMCDSINNEDDDHRMDTDTDCPEIEEIPDTRQEEMTWDTFDPYFFIKHLPPPTNEMRAKCPALPLKTRSSPEFSLVLDLDETLVHCSLQELADASFKFPVLFQDYKYTVFVRTRPFFREFLEKVSKIFEVILFTASKRVYADKLLNLLDPERKWIKYRLFREHCVLVNGNYIKDLTILGRDLSKTIIIDNSPQAFGYQLENGIPIESWFVDQNDSELMKILPFLEKLAIMREDVRPHIREKYRLFSYLPPD